MRRITYAVMSTLSALVVLFSYHTSTNSQASTTGTGAGTSGTGTTPSAATTSGSPSGSGTYTGAAASTRWGTVQVKITVTGGKIAKSEAIQYPNGNPRDAEINAYAVPQLNSEAVQKQSGSIDTVSGATVTSDGYIQSLQSAIDAAHL